MGEAGQYIDHSRGARARMIRRGTPMKRTRNGRVAGRFLAIAFAAAALAALAAGCDGLANQSDSKSSALPATVDIAIVGAVISPADGSGANWDGVGSLSSDIAAKLTELKPELAEAQDIIDFFTENILTAFDPPDPIGTASIDRGNGAGFVDGITLATDDNNQEDTYKPIWPNASGTNAAPGWKGVTTSKNMKIKVNVIDADLGNWMNPDDPIGEAVIGYDDIAAAYSAGTTYHVNTSAQTNNLLMLVDIQVK
jgi:hypothetical protein